MTSQQAIARDDLPPLENGTVGDIQWVPGAGASQNPMDWLG